MSLLRACHSGNRALGLRRSMSASCCLEALTLIPLGKPFYCSNTQFLFRVEKRIQLTLMCQPCLQLFGVSRGKVQSVCVAAFQLHCDSRQGLWYCLSSIDSVNRGTDGQMTSNPNINPSCKNVHINYFTPLAYYFECATGSSSPNQRPTV
jgi:hypothetical protein